MKKLAAAFLLLLACGLGLAEDKKKLTNSDIVGMVKAGLPESTVVMTIKANPSSFDTSPNALITLKKSGVSGPVLEAMIQAASGKGAPAATSQPTATAPAAQPESQLSALAARWGSKQTRIEVDRVFLIDGDKRTEMKYTAPGTRSRFVFVMQTFAVLTGPSARLRLSTRQPEFEMILPNNVEVSSLIGLGLLAQRSNESREIMISSAHALSMTSGLPPERNMRLDFTKAPDQGEAPEGYEIYRIKPTNPLKPGEYAFIVNKPAHNTMGAFGGAAMNYNFYDLGID